MVAKYAISTMLVFIRNVEDLHWFLDVFGIEGDERREVNVWYVSLEPEDLFILYAGKFVRLKRVQNSYD